jgi:branched-chain amino acid transport system substrate-binding protein
MIRLRQGSPRSSLVLILLGLSAALLLAAGCGSSGGPGAAEGPDDGGRTDRADELFQQLEQAYGLEQDGRTLQLANQILALYPEYVRNDRVLDMASEAAVRRRDSSGALDYIERLADGHPGSDRLPGALDRAAGLALAEEDTIRAAGYLVDAFALDPAEPEDSSVAPTTVLLRTLPAGDLETMADRHREDGADPYLTFLVVERLLEEGSISSARDQADMLAERAPESPWTQATLGLVGGGAAGGLMVAGPVDGRRVGIVCPLTGRYAVLGNAFYEAALMALDVANAEAGTELELVVEDSGGDPVMSALAGRRLVGPEGCVALLGSLMSGPTASLAVVADQYGVPLVSPTATNDRIWELGEGIFQTNLTGLFEVRLMARLATTVLLKRTYGLLYPDTPEARRLVEVFRNEVEALGGTVVVEAAFPSQGTDFKPPIQAVRQERPEVIFTPASVDQMVMLGPQLDFFRAGSLVMGLGNWNNAKLAEHSKSVLERALFPDDQALVPPEWTGEFHERWEEENYPREATALALRSYQATRLLLDTLVRSGAESRPEMADALRRRMADQSVDTEGPESFARVVHMFRDGEIVPFPAEIFTESWILAQADADTLDFPADEETDIDQDLIGE